MSIQITIQKKKKHTQFVSPAAHECLQFIKNAEQ